MPAQATLTMSTAAVLYGCGDNRADGEEMRVEMAMSFGIDRLRVGVRWLRLGYGGIDRSSMAFQVRPRLSRSRRWQTPPRPLSPPLPPQGQHSTLVPSSPPSSVVRRTLFLSALPGAIIHPSSLAPVQEGIYLFRNGVDPYSGGTFRYVRPLLLLCSSERRGRLIAPSLSRPYTSLCFHLASSLGDQCRRPTDIC